MVKHSEVYGSVFFKFLLFLCPFILGVTGYLTAGETVTNALYASMALYFVNPVSDGLNIWIEAARWTAPLASATALLYTFTKLLAYLKWRIGCSFHDSVAVYTDSDIKIKFGDKVREIYSTIVRKSAKTHIILMKSDTASFDFYEKHIKKLKNKKVYIGLYEVDLGLMKENPNVNYFDVSGTIARLLWKKIKVWNREKKDSLKIVIWGEGALAERILSYGLLLNLFSVSQHIKYVMVGDIFFQIKHPQMCLMNYDTILFLQHEDEEVWNELHEADIVIIADELTSAFFQTLAICARKADLYYFSRHEGDIGDVVSAGTITAFGRDEEIYTDECIRQEKLIAEAKRLNELYAEKYHGVSDWNQLSGFLKWSNISSADFMQVLEDIISRTPSVDNDMLAELEHIRWCRFHYLNYWKFGIPQNGKTKDEKNKIHSCLRQFNDLSENDKNKDRAVVAEIRSKAVMT